MKTLKISLVQLLLGVVLVASSGPLAHADSLYRFQQITCAGSYNPGTYSSDFSHIYLVIKSSRNTLTDMLGQVRELPVSWAFDFGNTDAQAEASYKNPLSQTTPSVFSPGLTVTFDGAKKKVTRRDQYSGITSLALVFESSDAQKDYFSGIYFDRALDSTYQVKCEAIR